MATEASAATGGIRPQSDRAAARGIRPRHLHLQHEQPERRHRRHVHGAAHPGALRRREHGDGDDPGRPARAADGGRLRLLRRSDAAIRRRLHLHQPHAPPVPRIPLVVELGDLARHLYGHPRGLSRAVRPLRALPRAGVRLRQPDARRLRRQLQPQVVDLRRRIAPAHLLRDRLRAGDAALLPHPERDVRDRDDRRRRRPRDPRRPQPDRHRERLQRLHLRRRRRRQRDGEPEQVLPEPSAEQLRPETDDVRDGVAALHHPLRHHVELHRRRGAKREALAVHRHAGLDRLRDDPYAVARARPEPRRRHDVPRPARLSAAAGRAERPRDRQPADLQRGDRHDGSEPGMARAASWA